nr:hypothetical protein [Tanacetum cinerariifolium]
MAGDDASKFSSSGLSLNFGDPLYLHLNDTGGSSIVSVKLMDGTCKKNVSDTALANQWDMCNSVVFTWIINSLSPDLYAGVIYAKSAYELWNDLKETYAKVDGFAVFNLHKNINSLTQSGSSLAEYYNNLNSL